MRALLNEGGVALVVRANDAAEQQMVVQELLANSTTSVTSHQIADGS